MLILWFECLTLENNCCQKTICSTVKIRSSKPVLVHKQVCQNRIFLISVPWGKMLFSRNLQALILNKIWYCRATPHPLHYQTIGLFFYSCNSIWGDRSRCSCSAFCYPPTANKLFFRVLNEIQTAFPDTFRVKQTYLIKTGAVLLQFMLDGKEKHAVNWISARDLPIKVNCHDRLL